MLYFRFLERILKDQYQFGIYEILSFDFHREQWFKFLAIRRKQIKAAMDITKICYNLYETEYRNSFMSTIILFYSRCSAQPMFPRKQLKDGSNEISTSIILFPP